MRGTPPSRLKRVLFTLHHDLQEKEPKLQKVTMMSEGSCVLSPCMHQFIEISICALENKINSNISMSRDPWKSVRQRVFPCTAAETIGRTKLPSSVWEENKFRGFPYETPTMPVVYRRSSQCFTEKKKLSKNIQTYLDIMWLFQNRYPFQWRNLSSSIWV